MSPEVDAAIITGVLGLLGIMVTLYRDEIGNLFKKRRRNIQGLWTGDGQDIEIPPHLTYSTNQVYEVNFRFKQSGNRIKSDVVISEKNLKKHWEAKAQGEFISDNYIHIEYKICVEGSLHFGVVLLNINELGNKMNGYFLAKRVVENGIVFGKVQLTKVSNKE